MLNIIFCFNSFLPIILFEILMYAWLITKVRKRKGKKTRILIDKNKETINENRMKMSKKKKKSLSFQNTHYSIYYNIKYCYWQM